MAKVRSVTRCRKADEFVRAVSSQGGVIENGGKGVKMFRERESRAYAELHARHKKELATGTRCALIKTLLKLGFVVWMVAWAWQAGGGL